MSLSDNIRLYITRIIAPVSSSMTVFIIVTLICVADVVNRYATWETSITNAQTFINVQCPMTHLDEPLVVLDHVGEHAEDAEELVRALLGEHRVVPSLVVLKETIYTHFGITDNMN